MKLYEARCEFVFHLNVISQLIQISPACGKPVFIIMIIGCGLHLILTSGVVSDNQVSGGRSVILHEKTVYVCGRDKTYSIQEYMIKHITLVEEINLLSVFELVCDLSEDQHAPSV